MIAPPGDRRAVSPALDRDGTALEGSTRRHGLLVLALVVASFANALGGPFLFDDTQPRVAFAWRSRPLTWLSFAFNRAFSVSDTLGYHLVNVGLHAACALLLLAFLRHALRLGARDLAPRTRAGLALAATLLWAVHPLQTESVSYISQRAESLASLFYLAFLYAGLRAREARRAWPWMAAAWLALVLGFASKEIVATAPILGWILAWTLAPGAAPARTRRAFGAVLALSWVALLVVFVAPPLFAERSSSGFGVAGVSPLEYLRTQPGVLLHYLRLAGWPHPLCLDLAWPVARTWTEFVPQGLVVLGLLALCVFGLWRRSWLGLAGAWFFVILAPTSSFVPIQDLAFEHRTYLALAAPLFVAVVAGWRLCRRLAPRAPGLPRILAGALVLALAVTTARRNQDYRSAIAMWQSVVACDPTNARAYENLSGPLIEAGRTEEAITALDTALRLAPSALAYNNLAAIEMNAGRLDQAIATLTKALVADPAYDVSFSNLGDCYLRRGETERARQYYEQALARLDSPYAHRGLGQAFLALERLREAEAHFQRALELDPTDASARAGLERTRLRLRAGAGPR